MSAGVCSPPRRRDLRRPDIRKPAAIPMEPHKTNFVKRVTHVTGERLAELP